MCSEEKQDREPGPVPEWLENMLQPMPVTRKIKLALRNNAIKFGTRSTCCGHYGEPGC